MKYKIASPLEKYKIKSGEDIRSFKIQKTEDKVILRFDEENQVFYARIINPSQHTRYLFQQGRLGISLCKLNTGKSQRKHQGDKYMPGDRYWDDREEKWRGYTDFYVKKKCHPRWSRCREVFSPVDSLDEEIQINCENYEHGWDLLLKPHQRSTLGEEHINWFTSIKALLISCPHSSHDLYKDEILGCCRGYKTMSNRIKIKYDSINDKIVERKIQKKESHGNNYYRYYGFDANVVKNGNLFTITITNMGSRVQDSFNNGGGLRAHLEVKDAGHSYMRNGNTGRGRQGDPTSRYSKRFKYRRWRYRTNTEKGKFYLLRKYDLNINSNTFTFDCSNLSALDTPPAMASLLDLVNKKHKNSLSISRPLYIAITMIDINGLRRRIWRYNTGINHTWSK